MGSHRNLIASCSCKIDRGSNDPYLKAFLLSGKGNEQNYSFLLRPGENDRKLQ